MTKLWKPTRRSFLAGSAAAAGVAGLSSVPFSDALGATFPSENFNIIVPTREGGGADRLLRAVSGVWKNHLKGGVFEPGFFPGASGRVGYEIYMNKREANCYNMLFGNMGPEVLNWVVKAPTSFKFPGDYEYITRVDMDPSTIFVRADSPFKTIDDVIAEGKKRTLSVATSRLAHPASLGVLALGAKTGARFNLIPLSGGKKTKAGVATKETDIGCLPSGSVVSSGKTFRTLLVFNDKNVLGARLNNAPTANDHFGMSLPPLVSARAFALHKKAMDKYPERVDAIVSSLKNVFTDPAFKKAYIKTKAPYENIAYGGQKECNEYVKNIVDIGKEFKSLMTGKKK